MLYARFGTGSVLAVVRGDSRHIGSGGLMGLGIDGV